MKQLDRHGRWTAALAVAGRVVLATAVLATGLSATAGCGPRAVRGSEMPGLDEEAFGTGLDKKDLDGMLTEALEHMQSSPVIERWRKESSPRVAVLPIQNETSEHIDSALQALIHKIETALVNAGHLTVISLQDQPALMEEVRRQNTSSGYDAGQVSTWGKQLGAQYIVTGRVYSSDERMQGERRVQYTLFLRILDAETSGIVWQKEVQRTKAIVR